MTLSNDLLQWPIMTQHRSYDAEHEIVKPSSRGKVRRRPREATAAGREVGTAPPAIKSRPRGVEIVGWTPHCA